MANTKLAQIKINSIDVTAYAYDYAVIENFGNAIYTAKISFAPTITSVVTLDASQPVEIWEGYVTPTDVKIFSGYLENYEPDIGKINVKAFNKMYAAVRTALTAVTYDSSVPANPIFPAGKYSDAFYDLVTTYALLNATNGVSITDTGASPVITKLLAYNTSVKERLDAISQAMGWIYFYKASDDLVYFQPKQATANPLVLTVGGNVVQVPKWKYDKTDLINDLRIDGAYQESLITETFNGTGALTTFTLSFTPVGDVALYYSTTKNYQTTASVESERRVLGVTSSTTGNYDFTVDKATKKISTIGSGGAGLTGSGGVAVAGTNNVLAVYVASIPVPVHFQDDPSITSYLLHQRIINLTDVITVADAESRAQAVIDKFKTPFQSTTMQIAHNSANSYMVGDSITVVDNVSNPTVNGTFTIFGITRMFTTGYDELSIGDREFEPPEFFINIAEKLHALEQELYNENGVLVEIRTATMDLTLEPHSLTVDEDYINDSFILDHADNGVLYDPDETALIEDFESTAGFSAGSGSVALTITNDSTAGHFWVGTQGVNASWVAGAGTGVLEKTITAVDLSQETGVTGGTPVSGTFGFWAYMTTPASITEMRLRIGSSSSDYKEYIGKQYAYKVAGDAVSFAIDTAQLTLVLFDATDVDATAGAIDWTNITHFQARWAIASAGDITFDYSTASLGDVISLNGLGGRFTIKGTVTYNY